MYRGGEEKPPLRLNSEINVSPGILPLIWMVEITNSNGRTRKVIRVVGTQVFTQVFTVKRKSSFFFY